MKFALVVTECHGLFFGVLPDGQDDKARTLVLQDCRHVLYWSSGADSFVGLGFALADSFRPRIVVHGVTSVTDCGESEEEANRLWKGLIEAEPR